MSMLVAGIDSSTQSCKVVIRDARTGALVVARQSDLRIGADYSWNRGTAALIRNSLLDNP